MKSISIDNGHSWITPEQALERMPSHIIAHYMEHDTREAVHADLAPCSDLDFLTRYLQIADHDLVIG